MPPQKSLSSRRYILLNRATMECCSHYLCEPDKGKPCVYDHHEVFKAKQTFWEHFGIETVEREIGGMA